MSFWERIIGPSTATSIEAVFGRLSGLIGVDGARTEPAKAEQHHQVAFTIAVVALGAKTAKADGLVTRRRSGGFQAILHGGARRHGPRRAGL